MFDAQGEPANYWHDARRRAGRPLLGDLRRSRSEVRTRRRTRRRRGALHGDLEPRVHPGPGRRRSRPSSRELPAKNIDTGSSLERVATVLQGVDNVFETDLFRPRSRSPSRSPAGSTRPGRHDDVSLKVIAEHGRATTFLIADGVQPSNEGRGYILRRMLRRVVTHARRLGIEGGVFDAVITQRDRAVRRRVPGAPGERGVRPAGGDSEEERFAATLRQGLQLVRRREDARRGRDDPAGDEAFKLHDTFGFPLQLTQEIAADAGLAVDADRFADLLEEQRDRARSAAKKVDIGLEAGAVPPTEFVGYREHEAESPVRLLLGEDNAELDAAEEGERVRIFLERTPFYAEGGGQVGDQGQIRTDDRDGSRDRHRAGRRRTRSCTWASSSRVRSAHSSRRTRRSMRSGARRPPAPTPPRTSSTGRSSTCWASTRARRARSSRRVASASTSRIPRPVPHELLEEAELEANRRLAPTMPSRSTRRRSTRRRPRAPSRCSARNTATSSASSRWGTTRASCAAGPTCTAPGNVAR